MKLKKGRLFAVSGTIFFFILGLLFYSFGIPFSLQYSFSSQEISRVQFASQQVEELLEENKNSKQINQLLQADDVYHPLDLTYLSKRQMQKNSSFFAKSEAPSFHVVIPIGTDQQQGFLVAKQTKTHTLLMEQLLMQMIFSVSITCLLVAFVIWIKAKMWIKPIEKLCQQFTKYRREYDSKDMQFPQSIQKQNPLERRVSILEELWTQFRAMQEQLEEQVEELEYSKQTLEQTIQDLEKAKEHERRLVEVGKAVAELEHDIGNTNGAILLRCDLLLRNLDQEHLNTEDIVKALMYIRHIKINSIAIRGLTSEILDFVKGEPRAHRQVLGMEDFLDQLDVSLGFADIPIEFEVTNHIASVYIDAPKVIRVIVNLVKNSWEKLANQEDGMITIGFEKENSSDLLFWVQDNGSPISESVINNLFQSFQTNGKREGTGLGLSISQKIVELHEGWIRTENLLEKEGVRFTCYLPNGVKVRDSPVEYSPTDNLTALQAS